MATKALAPLATGRNVCSAALKGAVWGLGHSMGQLALGLFMVLFKDRLDSSVPALGNWSSAVVGATMLVIGIRSLCTVLQTNRAGVDRQPDHAYQSGSFVQKGISGHLYTLMTGVAFGMQPDALVLLIPTLALPSKAAAASYNFSLVIGTVLAMGCYTALIGATSGALQQKSPSSSLYLSAAAAILAIFYGCKELITNVNV